MASTVIIQGQLSDGQVFSEHEVKHLNLSVKDKIDTHDHILDLLYPEDSFSVISDPVVTEITQCFATQAATLGGNGIYSFPSDAYLGEVFFEVHLAATSAGAWCQNVGMNIIEHVKIEHASNTLHEYQYDLVMNAILARRSHKEAAELYRLSGGDVGDTTLAKGSGIIPTFWSRYLKHHSESDQGYPLPLFASHDDLRLTLTLRTAAKLYDNTADGAGGSLTTFTVFYEKIQTTVKNMAYTADKLIDTVYKSVDFQTKDYVALTGSATDDANLSFITGSLKALHVLSATATKITTNHLRFELDNNLSPLYLRISNSEHDQSTTFVAGTQMRSFINGSSGQRVWDGAAYKDCPAPQVFNFGIGNVGSNNDAFFGGHMTKSNNRNITVHYTETSAADMKVAFVGEVHAKYKYNGDSHMWERFR